MNSTINLWAREIIDEIYDFKKLNTEKQAARKPTTELGCSSRGVVGERVTQYQS
jgi:hypothetical protein